jgi:hypothetical protein
VANTLNLFRSGAVGFIDWLDDTLMQHVERETKNEIYGNERNCESNEPWFLPNENGAPHENEADGKKRQKNSFEI